MDPMAPIRDRQFLGIGEPEDVEGIYAKKHIQLYQNMRNGGSCF